MKTAKIVVLTTIVSISLLLRLLPIKWGLPSKNLTLSSYNPDEQISFHSLERMNPKKFDFYPRQTLDWGSTHIYLLGITVKIAEVLHFVKIGNREYYLQNLKEVDKLYILGRLLSVISGTLSVLLLFFIIKFAFNNEFTAFFSASILAISPVHVINSFYVRTDILMMFLGLFVILFSLKIIATGKIKYYVLSGIFLGLTTATKYSGGAYFILPVIAHLVRSDWKIFEKQVYLSKSFWIMFFVAIFTFAVGCPYSVLGTPLFLASVKHLIAQAGGEWYSSRFTSSPSWWLYLTEYLPYAIGIPLLGCGLTGLLIMIFAKSNRKNNQFFAISGIIIFILITRPTFQSLWHTIPVIPFLAIYSGYLFYRLLMLSNFKLRVIGIIVLFLAFFYTGVYSLAYENLFLEKNVREEASEWIEKNIPKTAVVGIARSWFWTPAILRQYNPPYKLLMGGDIHSDLGKAVLGMTHVAKEADYLVLSEFEYRQFIHPKVEKYYPEQSKIIKEILFGDKFLKTAEFDREAKFFWFKFKKNYPPTDWLIPNPRIIILKKNEK